MGFVESAKAACWTEEPRKPVSETAHLSTCRRKAPRGLKGLFHLVHLSQPRCPQKVSSPRQQSRHVSGWLKSPFYQVEQLSGVTSERPDCLFMRKQDAQFMSPVLLLFVGLGCVMVAANGFSSGICWHSVKSIYQRPLAHLHTCNPFCFVLQSNLLPDTRALKMINGKVASFPSCTQMSLWKIFNGLSVAFHVTTCQVLRNSRVSP